MITAKGNVQLHSQIHMHKTRRLGRKGSKAGQGSKDCFLASDEGGTSEPAQKSLNTGTRASKRRGLDPPGLDGITKRRPLFDFLTSETGIWAPVIAESQESLWRNPPSLAYQSICLPPPPTALPLGEHSRRGTENQANCHLVPLTPHRPRHKRTSRVLWSA